MEPLTLALMAAGGVSQVLGGSAQRKQANQSLAEQMRMFDAQMRMAQATRTDAYGNETGYNKDIGEFYTNLTPMQKAIMNAQQREQFIGLTEDAGRNRAARRRQAAIGESSADDYNRENAAYRYEPRKNEDQIYGEITSLLNRQRNAPNAANTRQSLRHGQPLVRASNEAQGPDPAQQALMARKAALEEFIARESGRNQRFLPSMGFFREGAGGGGGAPISMSNQSGALSNTQDSMAKLIASVGQSGAGNMLKANEGVIKAIDSMYPDMKDFAAFMPRNRYAGTSGGQGRGGAVPRTPGKVSQKFGDDDDWRYEE